MTTTGPHFREDLLCGPPLNDLGDLRLGRGVYIVLSRPLFRGQKSGVNAREVESGMESAYLVIVHALQ